MTVVRCYVWSGNLVNDEALTQWEAVAPKTNKQTSKQTNKPLLMKYSGWSSHSRTLLSLLASQDIFLIATRSTLGAKLISPN